MSKRYDYKTLARTPSLKKKIALFLATEEFNKNPHKYNIVEILAFGSRPYVSMSEKDLLKLFDESYNAKLEAIVEKEKTIPDLHPTWFRESVKERLNKLKQELAKQDELMSEIVEASFSE